MVAHSDTAHPRPRVTANPSVAHATPTSTGVTCTDADGRCCCTKEDLEPAVGADAYDGPSGFFLG